MITVRRLMGSILHSFHEQNAPINTSHDSRDDLSWPLAVAPLLAGSLLGAPRRHSSF